MAVAVVVVLNWVSFVNDSDVIKIHTQDYSFLAHEFSTISFKYW